MGLLLILLVLLAVACQDDMGMSRSSSTAEQTKPGGIRVSIDNSRPFSVTRAKLVDSPGISMDVEWEGGDATGVYSTKGDNLQYTLAADDIESNNIGTFRNEAGTPEGEFYAYFPYEITAGGTPEGGLVLTMPATQQLNLDGAKPMPDDMASAMVGKGNAGNVTLHSVHAILKVGYVAMDSVDVMKYITFRDLNGKPVSGRYTVRLDDNGFPEATFPASGSEADDIITLECDSNYSTVTASDLRTFYLVVPARDYPQGFELTFYLKSGKSESKTIGKLAGKKLERAMVYPVGEVSIIREGSYVMEFNGEGFLMDEDQMALVENIWPIDYQQYYTPDYSAYSSDLSDMSKLVQSGPMKFAMVVDKRLDIHEDMTIVINRVSEALPYGLIAKVTAVDKQGDNQLYVELQRYAHIEGAFKKLQMGATRYNADGTPLDEQGINLGIDEQNLAAATEDPNAAENLVPYDSLDAVTDSIPEYLYDDVPVAPEDSLGETYEDEEASSLLVSRGFTAGATSRPAPSRATAPHRIYKHNSNTYTLARKSYQLKERKEEKGNYSNSANLTVGAVASLGTYISIDVQDMRLNHLFLRLTPSLDVEVAAQFNWSYSKEGTIKDAKTKADKSWDLGHLYFSPIAVGPLVFVPECVSSVGASFNAKMTLEAKWRYHAAVELELKYYRIYKNGSPTDWWKWGSVDYDEVFDGHIRNKSMDPSWSRLIPNLAVNMEMSATGSFYMNFGIAVYGLIDLTAYVRPSVTAKMGLSAATEYQYPHGYIAKNYNGFLELSPGLGYGLRVGKKYVPLGDMEMNPLWRREIFPNVGSVKNMGKSQINLGNFKVSHDEPERSWVNEKYVHVPIEAELTGTPFANMQLRWRVSCYSPLYPALAYIDAGTYSGSQEKQKVRLNLRMNANAYHTPNYAEAIKDYGFVKSLFPTFNNTDVESYWRSTCKPFGYTYYVTLEGRYGSGGWWPLPWIGSPIGEVSLMHWVNNKDIEEEKDKEGNGTRVYKGKAWGILVEDDEGYWTSGKTDSDPYEFRKRE